MNFNVYVSDSLGRQIAVLSKEEGKSRNALIREAIECYLKSKTHTTWPQEVLEFKGIEEEIPSFESFRSELNPLLNQKIF